MDMNNVASQIDNFSEETESEPGEIYGVGVLVTYLANNYHLAKQAFVRRWFKQRVYRQKAQYIDSYIILRDGQARFQKIHIESHKIELDIEMERDKPIYYGMEHASAVDYFYQILATEKSQLIVIRESRIQQLLKNYYTLCEFHIIEALSRLYFLQPESQVFISTLMHGAQKFRASKNFVIYKFGEPPRGFYLVIEGEVRIFGQINHDQSSLLVKKLVSRKVVQKILGKNQSFGEQDLFLSMNKRAEQAEVHSIECELLFIPAESLVQAYQDKYQDSKFQICQQADTFQEYLNKQLRNAQKSIDRHIMVHNPNIDVKHDMTPADPLFMNLKPLNQMKYSMFDYPKDVLRASSLYSKEKVMKKQVHRMPSQEVFVNESLAKINKIEGFLSVQDYIQQVKTNATVCKRKKSERLGKGNISVATDLQLKMIDYTRQLTPLHLVQRRSNPSTRHNSQYQISNSQSKVKNFLMLYPEYQKI